MLYTWRRKFLNDWSDGEPTEISLNQVPSCYKPSLQKNLEVQKWSSGHVGQQEEAGNFIETLCFEVLVNEAAKMAGLENLNLFLTKLGAKPWPIQSFP